MSLYIYYTAHTIFALYSLVSFVLVCITYSWGMLGRTSNFPFNEGWILFSTLTSSTYRRVCKFSKQFKENIKTILSELGFFEMLGEMWEQICAISSFLITGQMIIWIIQAGHFAEYNAEPNHVIYSRPNLSLLEKSVFFFFFWHLIFPNISKFWLAHSYS